MANASGGLTLAQRLAAPFREFGPGAGTLYLIDRLLRRLSQRFALQVYEIMAQPVSATPLLPPHRAQNLAFAEIRPDHPDLVRMPVPAGVLAARFEQGARCLAGYRAGKMIGYLWWSRDRYDEDEVRCTYVLADRDRSVFDFDFYIFPEHRMGTGFLALWQGANELLSREGSTYTFSRMTRFNLASRRAHSRLGARCVGRATFLVLGGIQLMVSSLRPYGSITWNEKRRAEVLIARPNS